MRPDLGRKVFDRQTDQKAWYVKISKGREFTLVEEVLVQDFRGEPNWLDGTVTDQPGPVSYKVLVGEQLWKRRVDQMHQKYLSNKDSKPEISVTHSNDTTDIQLVTPPQPLFGALLAVYQTDVWSFRRIRCHSHCKE